MKTIKPDDRRIIWGGAVSLERGRGWVRPWRLPCDRLDLFAEALCLRAGSCAGIRIRFATNATAIKYGFQPLEIDSANFDLYLDDRLFEVQNVVKDQTDIAFANLPPGMKIAELWLPQAAVCRLTGIRINRGAKLQKATDRRPRWITYGSSITHCGAAASPSFTWPGVAARKAGLNLTCLGFGGQCHADPMVAQLIRDLPADLISLKLGINIYGAASLGPRAFRPAVIGTIATIREKHPRTPLVVCSPIWSAQRETTENKVGFTLPMMRAEIVAAVQAFIRHGDRRIYYVDGLKLFGPKLAKYLPDNLHPNAEGYRRLGENFHREVFQKLGIAL